MKQRIQSVATFVTDHKKILLISTASIFALVVVVLLVALFIYNNPQKIVYQPTKACDLLTPLKAEDLLGNKVISVDTKAPVITDNLAVSKCSYTDSNPVKDAMRVAAVAVRSGINDKGVGQNKSDFATNKPATNVEAVNGLGESAYFNHALGQLNILDGRRWIIVSYGVGSAPEANTVNDAVSLAHKILR